MDTRYRDSKLHTCGFSVTPRCKSCCKPGSKTCKTSLSTGGSSFTINVIDYAQYRKIIVFGRNAGYEYPKRFGTRWYSVLWFAMLSNKPCCDQHSTAGLISSAFRKGSWKNYVPIHLSHVHDKLLKAKSMPSCSQKAENLSEKMHLLPSATLAYVYFVSDVDYFR